MIRHQTMCYKKHDYVEDTNVYDNILYKWNTHYKYFELFITELNYPFKSIAVFNFFICP